MSAFSTLCGVILSAAGFQAERRACPEPHGEGISLPTGLWATRFLAPLVKTRGFGMTPMKKVTGSERSRLWGGARGFGMTPQIHRISNWAGIGEAACAVGK